MKNTFLIFLCCFSLVAKAQDVTIQKVATEVSGVTVFIKGAQVERTKEITLEKGISLIKFIGLSPYIDAKSIKAKSDQGSIIHAINFQKNSLGNSKESQEYNALRHELLTNTDELVLERTHLDILKEELIFLQNNRSIGGRNQELSITNLKSATDFYTQKVTAIKLKEIERNKNVKALIERNNKIKEELRNRAGKENAATGEIWVKIASNISQKVQFDLKYLVNNASWYPTYDIRSKSIQDPIEITYKANVKQDTKVDWNNVKISFSSAEPNNADQAPALIPYFLDYGTVPPVYGKEVAAVSGVVADASGPLPGVNITVDGTTVGTTTDFDGRYSLSLPKNGKSITYSYMGYVRVTRTVSSNVINVKMQEDQKMLEKVVVVGYGAVDSNKRFKEKSKSLSRKDERRIDSQYIIPTSVKMNQTSFEFKINKPYTVKSDNKNYSVEMNKNSIAADYSYLSIPKIDKNAYLLASIVDWEKYNFMEGEANLYFEDMYVGKTVLETNTHTDNLSIALGKDKNVVVDRVKTKNYKHKKFISTTQEESKEWLISVKNNKQQPIKIIVKDQIPVSKHYEINIQHINLSGAAFNSKDGEVKWNLEMAPQDKKELEFHYLVKYPKKKQVLLD